MELVKNWKLKKVISVVNKIADAKINQGVILKELAHSIQAHQKTKTSKEWAKYVFRALRLMHEKEKEFLK